MAQISKEYATALFALACEQGKEQEILEALEQAQQVFSEQVEYMELLSSPAVPLGERIQALEQAFGEYLPEQVVCFIQLLCEKARIRSYADCVEEYRRLLHVRQSVVIANVTSAVALTEAEMASLKRKLEQNSGSTVTLQCSVDPQLLGGVVVEMNGRVMDGSLRHRLREVKEVMDG